MNSHAISLATTLRADPHPTPDYRVCRTESDFLSYLGTTHNLLLAHDTESLPSGRPYCVTFSNLPGTGRLIYTHDAGLIYLYGQHLRKLKPHQLFHNYLHDVIPLTHLGLPIDQFTDTMVRAYHLCLGGGGDDEDSESKAGRGSLSLKSLAYRHCNMKMTSFKDTVYPHSLPYLIQWLQTATHGLTPLNPIKLCTCSHPRSAHKGTKQTGKCLTCYDCKRWSPDKSIGKLSDQDQLLKRLYTKAVNFTQKLINNPDTDYADSKNDPWKKIRTNWDDPSDLSTLSLFAGPIPTPSIEYVPEPELLFYACRDADATLRMYLKMLTLNPFVFWP